MPAKLPEFIPPMLATPAEPFDSDDYLFEIKWDGIRALTFIDGGSYRLINRRRLEMTERYPEFAFVKDLPPGTVLDGEVIVLKNGKPDFGSLMSREQARSARRISPLVRLLPANYLVFDLLYENYESLLNRPLHARRACLERLVKSIANPQFILSEGIIGKGAAFFAEVIKRDLEGVVAKRLDSRYLPGQRNDCWLKIKRQSEWLCAIVGFVPSGADDFRNLIIAAEQEGELRYVGRVGSGFSNAMRKQLNQLLWSRLVPKPCVPCKVKGKWVKPGLYCRVRFMEQTENGDLRAPAFKELVISEEPPEQTATFAAEPLVEEAPAVPTPAIEAPVAEVQIAEIRVTDTPVTSADPVAPGSDDPNGETNADHG